MRAYPNDLRRQILTSYEVGDETIAGLARRFMVSIQYVKKVIRQKRKTGLADLIPQKRGTPRRFLAEPCQHLAGWVQADRSQTYVKLKGRFRDELGLVLSVTQIWRMVKKLDLRCAGNKKDGPCPSEPLGRDVDGQVEAELEHVSSWNGSNLAEGILLMETRREADLPNKEDTEEEIILALKEFAGGEENSADANRKLGISEGLFCQQKERCNEFEKQELHELRALRAENGRLKRIIADLMLDRHIIQRIVSKDPSSPASGDC